MMQESNVKSEKPALILTGPTGVGKTELSVRLARRRPFGLISADSMQVYRGMEIGTAQPSPEELQGHRLHCCGVIEPDEPFSVKRFLELSDEAREAILAEGKIPLYVGGTGMYLRALRWGLFEQPEADPGLRERLRQEMESVGAPVMHERLSRIDPEIAERISPNDGVRILRALEVAHLSGQPLSSLQTQWENPIPRFPHLLVILNAPREIVVERIERRVDRMLAAGWVDEVRRLLAKGHDPELHCFKALGYREIVDFLNERIDEEEMIERIKARTRQFAKRQLTWFRKERDAHWVETESGNTTEALIEIENLLDPIR